jgi:hypothetical protein
LPVRGEQVLPLGELDPDQRGCSVSFAFSVVGAAVASAQPRGDAPPVRCRDEPAGEGGAAVVVDEPATADGSGVELVSEGVDGTEEGRVVIGVAGPGRDLAVRPAHRICWHAKEGGGIGDAAGCSELDERDRGGAPTWRNSAITSSGS